MNEEFQFIQIPSDEAFGNDENLSQVSRAAANLMISLIDYIEREFKTDRTRATCAAGVLVGSLSTMIENNEGGREGVQELINEYNDYENQN